VALCLAVAAAALGYAIQENNGNFSPEAFTRLNVAMLFGLLAVCWPRVRAIERQGEKLPMVVLGLALGWNFCCLLTKVPGIYLRPNAAWGGLAWFFGGVGFAAFLSGAGLCYPSWLGRWRLPLLFAVHLFLGVWLINTSPNPFIDVHVFQREATTALLHGSNPYAITPVNIYGDNTPFYGPGVSQNGHLLFGYPYLPFTLLMALPGQLFWGDYRYMQLLAITGAGALMSYARPGRLAQTAAALYMFTPRVFFVLEQGWTEPYIVLALAAVVFALCRGHQRLLPYLVGLFFASKQYVVFTFPALELLFASGTPWREKGRFLLKGVGVGVLITLPFVLWSFTAFWRSVVIWQTIQPYRKEALDYLSWAFGDVAQIPSWAQLLAPIAGLTVGAVAVWRVGRTAAGYGLATAMAAIAFFAFSKQAFCNYYFFGVGALCVALAATSTGASVPATPVEAKTQA
jgi:hypothetical protein